MFFKIGVFKNIANFYKKTLVWESLLNKVADLQNLFKRDSTTPVFL